MTRSFRFICNLPIRVIVFAAVCALLYMLTIQPARADAAPPPEPTVGGAAPYRPIETKVQMVSETVLIDALPSPTRWASIPDYWSGNRIRVSASFTMQNQGETEEKMQVVFPLTRLDYPDITSSYNIIHSSFVAQVDGNPVPTTEMTTPPELGKIPEDWKSVSTPDGIFPGDVQWAAFEVTFPVHQAVLLQVEYLMDGGSQGLHNVDYILETGAGWYGNILSADIIVRLPYPATGESVPKASSGYSFSGNEVRWKMVNFEPKRKDNLSVSFIDTNLWPPVLELRSRVEQYPDDAEAWYKLADKYSELGFWDSPGGLMIDNQHLVDLSIEATQKAIYFRPQWGDAHYQLAAVLWDNNPKVGIRPDDYYIHPRGKPALKDPAVQRVIQELKLAESFGITGVNPDYFVDLLNKTFPGLNLSKPVPTGKPPTPTPTPTLEPISGTAQMAIAMAAGNDRTCVLTLGGEVKCEGFFTFQLFDRMGDTKAVATGDGYTCLLSVAGGVKCSGRNDFGQLGDGSTANRTTFVDVNGLTGGVAVLVAGDQHTCALMTGGGVKCWGRNYFGQLGNGSTAYSLIPVDVAGLADGAASLVAGNDHTCALMSAGGIKCWGANGSGQLGDGSRIDRLEPVDVVGLPDDVTALAAGLTHTCALTSRGAVLCWGEDNQGPFDDSMILNHYEPVDVPGLDNDIKAIVAGDGYTCALTKEGGVQCWGRNNFGQLGDGTTADRPIPADVVGLSGGVTSLVAGNNHTCALLQDGEVKCWGMRDFGDDGIKWTGQSWDEPAYRPAPVNAIKLGLQLNPTPAPVPTKTPEPPSYTPAPSPTSMLAETSSPTWYPVLVIGLLLLIGLFVFLPKRA